jgi:DNA-binding transcriptional LysR family regulator
MIDIRLKVFRSVALNLSFTKASHELFISQPAISKHIHELEDEFHVRLFDRIGNRISLTNAGQQLLDDCAVIMDGYRKLDFDMNALRNKFCGELRIGASTTIAQYILPEILAHFIHQYPQFNVTMRSGNSLDIEDALQEGKIDIGLVEGITVQPHLKYTTFKDDELIAIVGKNSSLWDQDEISIEQLTQTPIVLRERGSGTLDVIEQCLGEHNIKLSNLNISMYLGSTEAIKRFVEQSSCIGIVSLFSVSKELLHGDFKVIEIKNLKMERILKFVEKRGDSDGPQILLKQFITSHYSR